MFRKPSLTSRILTRVLRRRPTDPVRNSTRKPNAWRSEIEQLEDRSVPATSAYSVNAVNFLNMSGWNGAIGSEFTLNQAVNLTELGAYDHGSNGFNAGATVRIWNASTQQLLATATVTSNSPAIDSAPMGVFRYAALSSPLSLAAGTPYRIAAYFPGSDPYLNATATPSSPIVLNGGAYSSSGTGDTFPSFTSTPSNTYFGANFRYDLAASSSPTAYHVGTYNTIGTGFAGAVGSEFNASQSVNLTKLGAYDYQSDGFYGGSAVVGVWNAATQQLLTSISVTSSSPIEGSAPQGNFRYATLSSPLSLSAGTSYRIAAYYPGGDPYLRAPASTSSPINLTAGAYSTYGTGMSFPSIVNNPADTYFGANFQYVIPPPTVVSTSPSLTGGTLAAGTTSLQVNFTQPMVGAGAPLGTNLASWWSANGDANDMLGAAHGSMLNGATFTSGKVGQAFQLDGVDDYIQTSTSTSMNSPSLTLESWVKPELRSDGTFFPANVISNDQPNAYGHGFGLNVFPGGSQLIVEYHDGNRVVPGVSFAANTWYHVATVYTPGNVKTYVNGALVDNFNFVQGPVNGVNFVRIGRHNDDFGSWGTRVSFKGAIDEPSVYTAALSASDIAALYAAGSSGQSRHLVANYELRSAGPDGLLGNGDDVLHAVTPSYSGTTATLTFPALAAGTYRLTVQDSMTNTAGTALDGDSNGTAGSDYVREFVVATNTVTLSGGNLTITETASRNDGITLSVNGTDLVIFDPTAVFSTNAGSGHGTNTVSIPLASITGSISVSTSSGNDTLVIDLAGGDVVAPGGLIFLGGSGIDALRIVGGNQGNVDYNYRSIVMQNFGTVTHDEVDSISNFGAVADAAFNLPNAFFGLVLEDDGTVGNNLTRLRGTSGAMVATAFSNPAGTLTINRGHSTETLTVNSAPDFTAGLTIGAAGAEFAVLNFSGALALAADKNLIARSTGTIALSTAANLGTSGTGAITLTTARNITIAAGASISAVAGDVRIEANRQTTATAGVFIGVDLRGSIRTTGLGGIVIRGQAGSANTSSRYGVLVVGAGAIEAGGGGNIEVDGIGGAGDGQGNVGIYIVGPGNAISAANGSVQLRGTAGGSSAITSNSNIGVYVRSGAQVTAGGTVTVTGTGHASGGASNYGVWVSEAGSLLSGTAGTTVVGTGAGTGSQSFNNIGVLVDYAAEISSSGPGVVSVTGTGTGGNGTDNNGLRISGTGSQITSTTGAIILEGSGSSTAAGVRIDGGTIRSGGNAPITVSTDSMDLATGAAIDSGSGTTTLRQKTNSTLINLGSSGGPTAGTLELSDAELDRITAGTVQIGDANLLGGIVITSPITHGNHLSLTANAGINFSTSLTMAPDKNLTASAGLATIYLPNATSDVAVSGTGSISFTTPRDIWLASTGASITAVDGNITLSANQQASPTVGADFQGIRVMGLIQITGTGTLQAWGRGGDVASLGQYGVFLESGGDIIGGTSGLTRVEGFGGASLGNGNYGISVASSGSQISSAGGPVQVLGTGGGAGASVSNHGVRLSSGGAITNAGTGSGSTVTVTGFGGNTSGTGGSNYGIDVNFSKITSSGGPVLVEGTGGGSPSSTNNIGVNVTAEGLITSGGTGAGATVTVIGTGNVTASGSGNSGVMLTMIGSIRSSGGAISVTGTGSPSSGGVANNGSINSSLNAAITVTTDRYSGGGTINSGSGSTTIRPRTNGTLISLGSTVDTTANTLELSDAELDRITAGTVHLGSNSTGTITVVAPITHANKLSLISGTGMIADANSTGADIITPSLSMTAAAGIGSFANPLEVETDTIPTVQAGAGHMVIDLFDANNGGVAVGTVSTSNGAIDFRSTTGGTSNTLSFGSMTAGGPFGINIVKHTPGDVTLTSALAAGGIYVEARGADGAIRHSSGTLQTTGNNVELVADRMDLAGGTIHSGIFTTILRPFTAGRNIEIGDGAPVAGSVLGLNQAALASIASENIAIGRSGLTTGTIAVVGSLALPSRRLDLITDSTSPAAISDGSPGAGGHLITANALVAFAYSGGIDLNLNTEFLATHSALDQYLEEEDAAAVQFIGAGSSTMNLARGAFQSIGFDIDDRTTVRVGAGATFDLNGVSDTIGGLTLETGTTTGAVVTTGDGTLTVSKSITVLATGTGAVGASISGTLNLGGANRIVTVADGVASSDLTIDAIVVNGGLVKRGTGTLTLTGENTYAGATSVATGELLLTGSIASNVFVGIIGLGDATFGGTGTISPQNTLEVRSVGTIAPGLSAGVLRTGPVNFLGGVLEIEIDGGAAGTGYDQLAVTGTAALGAGLATLSLSGNHVPAWGDSFAIVTADSVTGYFNGMPDGTTVVFNGRTLRVSYSSTAVTLTDVTNQAPLVQPDAYTAEMNGTLNVPAASGVLANDSDPDGGLHGMVAHLVNGPAHGSLTLEPNGAFVYVPAAGYTGPDSFTYEADDGIDRSSVVTVSLSVVDTTAPILQYVTGTDGTYKVGQTVTFQVLFDEAVTVSGSPTLPLQLGWWTATRYADYHSGSGTNQLVFCYVVQTGDAAPGGVRGSLIELNGGSIRDASGNAAILNSSNAWFSLPSVIVDGVPPTVARISRLSANPTNAATVQYEVEFSEPVTGVDTFDFIAYASPGVFGTVPTAVSGSGTTYTVTMSTGFGDGDFVFQLLDNDSIVDAAGNPLGGAGTGNGTFTGPNTDIDKTAPEVAISLAAGQTATTHQHTIAFTATFSEEVTGFDASDVTATVVGGTGEVTTDVVRVGDSYAITVTFLSGYGRVEVTVPAGVAVDAAGNGNRSGNLASVAYTPIVSIVGGNGENPLDEDAGSGVSFTFSRSGPVVGDLEVAFTLSGTADQESDFVVSGATHVSGDTWTVTIPDGSAFALVTIESRADSIVELDEDVILTVASGAGYTPAGDPATLLIPNDDSATISINDVTVIEGDFGTVAATFTISLSNPVDVAVTLRTDATARFDNNAILGWTDSSITFAPGEQTKNVTVQVNGDDLAEATEFINLALSWLRAEGRSVSISDDFGVGTILDDDFAPEADAGGEYRILEGSGLTLDASGTTDQDSNSLTFSWDLDNDGIADVTGVAPTLTAAELAALGLADGPSLHTVALTVSDGTNTTTITTTLQIDNVDPTFEAGADETILPPKLGAFSRRGITVIDPGSPEILEGTVDFGDGTPLQSVQIDPVTRAFDLNHTFPNANTDPAIHTYTVTVTVTDGDGGRHTDAFEVTVNLNTPPVAVDDAVSTGETSSVTFDVLSNDVDSQSNIVPSRTVVITSQVPAGLTNHGDGTFTFDPGVTYRSLAAGETSIVNFDYEVFDAFGESDVGTVQITIVGVNDRPEVAANVTSITVNEGETALADGTFFDWDLSDIVTITASVGQISHSSGSAGTWSWSFNSADGPDESLTVTITAEDRNGGVATTSFNLVIENVAPSVSLTGPTAAGEGETLTYTFVVEDPGADGFTVELDGGANGVVVPGSLALSATDGTFQVHFPDGAAVTTVSIRVTDTDGAASNSAGVEVSIDNLDPTAVTDNGSMDEDTSLTGDVLANDTDPAGAADPLYVTGADSLSAWGANVGVTPTGTYIYDPRASAAIQALSVGELIVDTFGYAIADGDGGIATGVVRITLAGVNDAPTAANGALSATERGGAVTTSVLADDVDSDNDAGSLIHTIISPPSAGTAISNGDGTFTFHPGSAFQYLAAGETTEVRFTFEVKDRHGATATATVVVVVTGVNNAPVAASVHLTAMEDGTPVSTVPLADDLDSDNDSADLVYTIVNGPSEGTVAILSDGSFTFDPGAAFQDLAAGESRVVSFTYRVTDVHGASAEGTVTITVEGANDGPVATADRFFTPEDTTLSVSASNGLLSNDSDADASDTRRVTAINGVTANVGRVTATAHGSVVVAADGSFNYTPGAETDGVAFDTFTYTVSDGQGGTSTATVTIDLIRYTGVTRDGSLLRVGGTAGADTISVSNGKLLLNSTEYSLAGVTEIRIWGRSGNDRINLEGLGIRSFVSGSAGADELIGGAGDDILIGGEGDDIITGGAGNDLLVGGFGSDRLVGSSGHDVLIAGQVGSSTSAGALRSLAEEWAATRTTSPTESSEADELVSDAESDKLTGGAGGDWFIINVDDIITDYPKGTNKDGDVVSFVS